MMLARSAKNLPYVRRAAALFALPLLAIGLSSTAQAQSASAVKGSCASLKSVAISGLTYAHAEPVGAGMFISPYGDYLSKEPVSYRDTPAFCRVAITIRPAPTSDIRAEIWLPDKWNGKFLGIGTGGLGGVIDYRAMIDGLKRGYAVANSDLGTSGGTEAMVGDMDRIADFGHRAVHAMTIAAKIMIAAHYKAAPAYSYFRGCSSGGGQGLIEAQRYPEDYDGILAGAPVTNRVAGHILYLGVYSATHAAPASIISQAKQSLWARTVINACDTLDGVKDGLIALPGRCRIDPAVLACKGADGPACLTAPQVDALRQVTAPVLNRLTGEVISPGYLHGSEVGKRWLSPDSDKAPDSMWPFQWIWGMNWDWRAFDFGKDAIAMTNALSTSVNGVSTDLKAFEARGGKLIVYHGLADSIVSPQSTMDYLDGVRRALPQEYDGFVKAYYAPGMSHCAGGVGPDDFGNYGAVLQGKTADPRADIMSSLEQWVEAKREPSEIIARKFNGPVATGNGKPIRTMPLCAWPKIARYDGKGPIDRAESYSCAVPQ